MNYAVGDRVIFTPVEDNPKHKSYAGFINGRFQGFDYLVRLDRNVDIIALEEELQPEPPEYESNDRKGETK